MSRIFSPQLAGNAGLGIDTLWGGDVMCASGTGRFIADSWFSDEPLPAAYTDPAAARVRETGGVCGEEPDREAIERYLAAVDVPARFAGLKDEAGQWRVCAASICAAWRCASRRCGTLRWNCWARAARCRTNAACRRPPGTALRRRDPEAKRERVAELLARAGHRFVESRRTARGRGRVAQAAPRPDGFRACARRRVHREVRPSSARANLVPYLPPELHSVPRANIEFLPIKDAWFSGSMNYLGRARKADGSPEYEATYEINASLEISVPEFEQLVSHEVVPGHVTTFAYLQNLYVPRHGGFRSHRADDEHARRQRCSRASRTTRF